MAKVKMKNKNYNNLKNMPNYMHDCKTRKEKTACAKAYYIGLGSGYGYDDKFELLSLFSNEKEIGSFLNGSMVGNYRKNKK